MKMSLSSLTASLTKNGLSFLITAHIFQDENIVNIVGGEMEIKHKSKN